MPQKIVQPQLLHPEAGWAPARQSLPTTTWWLAKVSGLAPSGPGDPPSATQAAPIALCDPC